MFNRNVTILTLLAFIFPHPCFATEENASFSVLKPSSGHREFYSSNKDNRFLIRVQLWGDIGLPGTHYLPDNSTLGELIGLAGGPSGDLEVGTITVTRPGLNVSKPLFTQTQMKGLEIVKRPEYQNFKLQNNDIVVVQYPPRIDNVVRTLTIVSAIVGIISTGLTLYLVLK